jgi:endonuclease/exonuclease/phosphatase family metal-dependent hydrolase
MVAVLESCGVRCSIGAAMSRREFLKMMPVATTAVVAAGCAGSAGNLPIHFAPLRVMTYNLHHGEGVDGKVDLERIARVIRESKADLVALQEVDVKTQRTGRVDQAAEYIRLTGLFGQFGKAIDFQGGAYGGMLLSRWPMEDFTVDLLPNPANREQRIAISARVRVPRLGEFRFVGVHLDASRGDDDRWLQVARLQELFGGSKDPVLLAGDFNDRPGSRVMQRMLADLEDASAGNPLPTIPAEKPEGRIDYVLLRPRGWWHQGRQSQVLEEPVASDHRPVLVELKG